MNQDSVWHTRGKGCRLFRALRAVEQHVCRLLRELPTEYVQREILRLKKNKYSSVTINTVEANLRNAMKKKQYTIRLLNYDTIRGKRLGFGPSMPKKMTTELL